MRIALATCSDLPGWEKDDWPFHAALTSLGIDFDLVVWDEETNWLQYDCCVIRTTWDYMQKQEAFVAWARHVGGQIPFFNSPAVIAWNTHKTYLRDLESAGIPIAPTEWLDAGSSVDVGAILEARGWSRGFIKPQVGATARETLRFDHSPEGVAAAEAHLNRTLKTESMMLQPYLERVESEGERSLLFMDGKLSHCVQKQPVAGDYRVQDDFGAKDFPVEATAAEMELAARAIEETRRLLNLDDTLLYARVDFLYDDSGSAVLNELELVEPSLFFRHCEESPMRLAQAIRRRLSD